MAPCEICNGTGRLLDSQCPLCWLESRSDDSDPADVAGDKISPLCWLETRSDDGDPADVAGDKVSVPNPDEESTPVSSSVLERMLATFDYPEGVSSVIACLQRATACVQGSRIFAFGSAVNGFGDSTSDIDLVLHASRPELKEGLNLGRVSQRDLAPRTLAYLQSRLRRVGISIHEKVLHARVPILKLSIRGMDCDLSVNNLLPVFNTRLLKSYATADDRVVEITSKLKAWAKEQDLHGASHGHLSSYSFTLMVIFYMQIRKALPCLQQKSSGKPIWYHEDSKKWNVAMDIVASSDKSDVTVSFSDFATFYTEEFTWGTHVVSVRTGKLDEVSSYPDLKRLPRSSLANEAEELLHIEDPFDTARNLNCVLSSGSSRKLLHALRNLAKGRVWRSPQRHLEEKQHPASQSFYSSRNSGGQSLYDAGRRTQEAHHGYGSWKCAACGSKEDLETDPTEHDVAYCKKCWEVWDAPEASVGDQLNAVLKGGRRWRTGKPRRISPVN